MKLQKISSYFTKDYWKRYGFLLIGVFFLALGGLFFSCSQIGMDPLSVFYSGVAVTLHLRLGTGVFLVGAVILGILLIWDRQRIGLGTVAIVVGVGPILNLLLRWFSYTAGNWPVKLLSCAAGILSYGIGMACYLHSNLGCGPVDAMMFHFEEKVPVSLRVFKIGFDVLCVVAGALLGGAFGIGTILAAFLSGPAMCAILKLLGDDTDAQKSKKKDAKERSVSQ